MPALTRFIDGSGPVVPGKLFPFCFITIACGAISGFHTLISSGITPKIITRETHARPVGYGAMLLESLVAIMAMIAACTLEPGVYLAMNIKVPGPDAAAIASATVAKVNAYGPEFALAPERMDALAREVKEESLYGRTGGAATLAVGMANLFSRVVGDRWLGIWYHFALMFEALFILTTLDAGTRVGRYLLQDALGHLWKPLGDVRSLRANVLASGLVVALWGYFLIAAVHDPDGGIKALWPIFGIANQLLATTALCLATTILLKMALGGSPGSPKSPRRSPALALVTLLPLLWLLAVTGTAAVQKIWHPTPSIGFLAGAAAAAEKRATLQASLAAPPAGTDSAATAKSIRQLERQAFNLRLNAVVTGFFLVLVAIIFLISAAEWLALLAGWKLAQLREDPPTWLPAHALSGGGAGASLGLLALLLALARHLSGEADLERARRQAEAAACACCEPGSEGRAPRVRLLDGEASAPPAPVPGPGQLYAETSERRFQGVSRCC
jgi:carbon starvation protein